MSLAKEVLTSPPKGVRDFLPDDVQKRNYVTGVIKEVYESYGFLPLETPAYERLDTLLGKYGEEGDQLLFKILHRGQPLVQGVREAAEFLKTEGAIVVGRSGETAPGAEKYLSDLGLRYDLTVPLARVYAEYQARLPAIFKRYQIQPVWRADTPGKGRFREFYQCDVDVIGSESRLVEAEVCAAVSECLTRLGFDRFTLRLNHRALLRTLVEAAGISVEHESDAIVAIDKLDKITPEEVKAELVEKKGIAPESAEKLLTFARLPNLEALARELGEKVATPIADLQSILEHLKGTPAEGRVAFDVSLARGLGYYTGAIFEIKVADLAGSLGGGGRYDGLIGMFLGKNVPACGFSLGLERILVVMEERKMYPPRLSVAQVLLAAADPSHMSRAFALAAELRRAGLRVDFLPKNEKPGKLRQLADQRGLPSAVWLDEKGELFAWFKHRPEERSRKIDIEELKQELQ